MVAGVDTAQAGNRGGPRTGDCEHVLDTLPRQGGGWSQVRVRLVEVKAGEVEADEANFTLTFANVDGARRCRCLPPICEVLAVCSSTIGKEVTTDPKPPGAGTTIFSTLK